MMSLRPPAKKIQEHFPAAEKKKLLVDVDGSLIQTFVADGKDINVTEDSNFTMDGLMVDCSRNGVLTKKILTHDWFAWVDRYTIMFTG